jgi:hypothetical protein
VRTVPRLVYAGDEMEEDAEDLAEIDANGEVRLSVAPKESEGLFGAGFVPDDDSSDAGQSILSAIRSIVRTPAAESASGGDAQ